MIDGVVVKNLSLIPDERGWLMEILRNDDPFFEEFGQTYVSAAYPGVVKAWHFHNEQVDHFVCVKGMIKLVMYDDRLDSSTRGDINEFFMGDRNPILVRIPNGVYHGYKSISDDESIVVNIPNRPYDREEPDEYRIPAHDNDIPYDWARQDG